jgi:hypothetical protein
LYESSSPRSAFEASEKGDGGDLVGGKQPERRNRDQRKVERFTHASLKLKTILF